jgi:hypothetical protein
MISELEFRREHAARKRAHYSQATSPFSRIPSRFAAVGAAMLAWRQRSISDMRAARSVSDRFFQFFAAAVLFVARRRTDGDDVLGGWYGAAERISRPRTPGLILRSDRRGPKTEINVTYEANPDLELIVIESRTLLPPLHDSITDTGD